MSVESIIQVGKQLLHKNAKINLDEFRIVLEPYIYTHLIAKYSSPLSKFWKDYCPPKQSKHAYVIVERRCHPNFEFILHSMAWANPTMAVYIFCSSENLEFIGALLGEKQKHFNIFLIPNAFDGTSIGREEGKHHYNNMLTSKAFYQQFTCDYILTIQMDVIIRRKIPDSIFCGDYWGNPWAWKSTEPGGGGATIRKVSTMLAISRGPDEPDITVPEDSYISDRIMENPRYTYPDLSFRASHIMENLPSPNPVLLHQFWTFFYVQYKLSKEQHSLYWKHLLTIDI